MASFYRHYKKLHCNDKIVLENLEFKDVVIDTDNTLLTYVIKTLVNYDLFRIVFFFNFLLKLKKHSFWYYPIQKGRQTGKKKRNIF